MARRTVVDPEDAVRQYLLYLEDPSKLVNAAEVKKAEAAIAKAGDPVARLKATAHLQQVKSADRAGLESAFIAHARRWAESEGVPQSAFATMAVPKAVLDAAFGAPKARKAKAAPAGRRTRSKPAQVEAGILAVPGEFTVRDAVAATGASTVTVKAAIDRLTAQRKVREAGERAGARGRAARTWKVA